MKFIDTHHDAWHTAGGEDGPIPHPAAKEGLLLTLEQWHAVRETWPAGLRTGVTLANTVDIETLEADLPRLSLVALQFPKWIDGRAYSQAHVLRVRLGYRGEVRATGDVLVDQLAQMQRTGFSSAVLRADQDAATGERLLRHYPAFYQGDAVNTAPLFAKAA